VVVAGVVVDEFVVDDVVAFDAFTPSLYTLQASS
jgi:hypothetical protein